MRSVNSTRIGCEVCPKASEARGSGVAMRSGWVKLGGVQAGRLGGTEGVRRSK